MKPLLSTLSLSIVLPVLLLSVSVVQVQSYGYMDTCEDQSKCLLVTVNEIQAECEVGSCEYEVCWRQLTGGVNGCQKYGDVEYLGDMHRYRDKNLHQGGCLNEENEDGKGYWDDQCQDPNHVYSSGFGFYSFFNKVCQVVPPGHTAHLLIYDGDSCDDPSNGSNPGAALTSTITSYGVELPIHCAPSTQDSNNDNPGGQTFFPDPDALNDGGTCSAKPEGEECVWSVTVPSGCSFEETGCQGETGENLNSDSVCDDNNNNFDVLEYYDNPNNGPPPKPAIHDIVLNGDGTVSFRVQSPYPEDFHDVYTVYPKPYNGEEGVWNEACAKEQAAKECTNDIVLTAQCLHEDQAFTIVTVFVAGYTDDSPSALNVLAEGTDIWKCCPTEMEPDNQTQPDHVSAFTYLIHCGCDDPTPARLLRVESGGGVSKSTRDAINFSFHNGDLFHDNEQLMEMYGLN